MDQSTSKKTKSKTPRCHVCRKKVGLLGFTCLCSDEHQFCSAHRLPEHHDCQFDRKTHEKELLSNKLVKVVNQKVVKI